MSAVSGKAPSSSLLRRAAALTISLGAHVALGLWLLATTLGVTIAPPPAPIAMELVRLPPPPPPPPPKDVEPPKKPEVRKQVRNQPPPEEPRQLLPALTPPPTPPKPAPAHRFASRNDDWGAVATQEDSGKGPRRVSMAYAEAVKSRVVANLEYPPGAVFKPPKKFKGDPNLLRRQCTIPYEITVDRQGNVISHRIEPCGDDLLDAAAEQALSKAGPFPPPPDQGADEYVIYGSANFRSQNSPDLRYRR